MGRTVLVDDKLPGEARAILGTASVQETIEQGLREAIRSRQLQGVVKSLGTFDLDMTVEDLLRIRAMDTEPLPGTGRAASGR